MGVTNSAEGKPSAPSTSVHGPYEDAIIAACELAGKVIDSQPKDVQADLWRMHVENLKRLQEFFENMAKLLNIQKEPHA